MSLINIIANNNQYSQDTALLLKDKLNRNGFEIADGFSADATLNIVVGGDGAFLRAVHSSNYSSIPFIGINTGHLGFFQELSPESLDTFINILKSKTYTLEDINLLNSVIFTPKRIFSIYGVNEISIKSKSARSVHLKVSVNNTYLERFSGDGVIISTPIGSTAYNYSTGGSIIYPSLNTLQLTPLAPINSKIYRSLNSSIIVPNHHYIELIPEYRDEDSLMITVDGLHHSYTNITKVLTRMSNRKITMLKIESKDFWSNVRDKFL
jgi:NAD+ kinase